MFRSRKGATLLSLAAVVALAVACSSNNNNTNTNTATQAATKAPTVAAATGTVLIGGGAATPAGTARPAGSPVSSPAAAAVAASPSTTVDNGTFKVGLLNPLTGAFAGIGKDVNQGFQLYLDQHGGKLGGFRISTVQEDDASVPATGQTKLRKLVEQDKINALVGLVSSAVAAGLRDYIDENKLITIDSVAGADDLTQRTKSDWIFRPSYTNSDEAHPLGDYACKKLGYKKVAMIALDYQYGWESSGGFARVFKECGGTITQEIYAPLNTADWAPFVQKIDQSGADAVMASIAGDDAIRFLKVYRDFGIKLPLIGLSNLTDELNLPQEGDTANGVLTTGHFSAVLDDPKVQAFVKAYSDKYGAVPGPGWYSESGYLSAQILDTALGNAGKKGTDPAALRTALKAVSIDDTSRGSSFKFDDYQQGVFNIYVRDTKKLPDGRYQNVIRPADTFKNVSQFWTYKPDEYLKGKTYDELKGTWAK